MLVVDDEHDVVSRTRQMLEDSQTSVTTAGSVAEALQRAAATSIDLALIDWRLGGQDDGIALGRALKRDYGIPFVIFSGFLNTETVGNAYKQGAADVIDKPLRPGRVRAAVELGLRAGPVRDPSVVPHHVGADSLARRWARLVLRACHATDDPSTEVAVAAAAGVSPSVLLRACARCGVKGRNTRDLARFLRALSRAQEDGSTLESHLSVIDARTSAGLFRRANLPIASSFVSLRAFLLNQQFVPSTKECLRELAHLAANDPMFLIEPDDPKNGTRDS